MEITYLSILLFFITTIVYYILPFIGKIPLTLDVLDDTTGTGKFNEFYTSNWIRLAIYFGFVVMTQYILNTVSIINNCGGDIVSNFTNGFLITFMPWVFIFGIMLIMLIVFPGFKSAFSDIIGYFIVANSANDVLSKILVDKEVDTALDGTGPETKELRNSAESIMKLYSNKAIIINQIVPENFMETWETLKPLMKPNVSDDLKSKLLDIVVMRDNIGEACWYLYTAIVIISFISYKLSMQECQNTIFDVEKESKKRQSDYDKQLKKEDAKNKK